MKFASRKGSSVNTIIFFVVVVPQFEIEIVVVEGVRVEFAQNLDAKEDHDANRGIVHDIDPDRDRDMNVENDATMTRV